jgi:hypothetical protein
MGALNAQNFWFSSWCIFRQFADFNYGNSYLKEAHLKNEENSRYAAMNDLIQTFIPNVFFIKYTITRY